MRNAYNELMGEKKRVCIDVFKGEEADGAETSGNILSAAVGRRKEEERDEEGESELFSLDGCLRKEGVEPRGVAACLGVAVPLVVLGERENKFACFLVAGSWSEFAPFSLYPLE